MAIDVKWIQAKVPQEKNRELYQAAKKNAAEIMRINDTQEQEREILKSDYCYQLSLYYVNELQNQIEQSAAPATPQNDDLLMQYQDENKRLKSELAEANAKLFHFEVGESAGQSQKSGRFVTVLGDGKPSAMLVFNGGDSDENEAECRENHAEPEKEASPKNQPDQSQSGDTVSKSELICANNEIEKLRHELKTLKQQQSSNVPSGNAGTDDIARELDDTSRELRMVKRENTYLQDRVERLNEELGRMKTAEEKNSSALQELDDTTRELRKVKKENADLQDQIDRLNEELDRMKAAEEQNSKASQEEDNPLQREFENMKKEMAALQGRMKSRNQIAEGDWQSLYEACFAENEDLREQLAAKSKETTKLTRQLLNMRRSQDAASEDENKEADAQ